MGNKGYDGFVQISIPDRIAAFSPTPTSLYLYYKAIALPYLYNLQTTIFNWV